MYLYNNNLIGDSHFIKVLIKILYRKINNKIFKNIKFNKINKK